MTKTSTDITAQQHLSGVGNRKAGFHQLLQPPQHSSLVQKPPSLTSPNAAAVDAAFGSLDESWDARFEALRSFYRRHGHCNVPVSSSSPNGSSYAGLALWVKQQRREYAIYNASGKREYSALHAMTPARIVKLMMLNFRWEEPNVSEDFENEYDHYRPNDHHKQQEDLTAANATTNHHVEDAQANPTHAIAWVEQTEGKLEGNETKIWEAVGHIEPERQKEQELEEVETFRLAQSLINLQTSGKSVDLGSKTKKRKLVSTAAFGDDEMDASSPSHHMAALLTKIKKADNSAMQNKNQECGCSGSGGESVCSTSSQNQEARRQEECINRSFSTENLKTKGETERQIGELVEKRTNGYSRAMEVALLPDDFVPGPWSVVVGRDKAAVNAIGNKRLHVLAAIYLTKYATSEQKQDKTDIINEIEQTIRSACGEKNGVPVGSFVKFVDGKWWEVEAWVGREKIGRTLREPLHAKYSSTSKVKRARKMLRRQKKKAEMLETTAKRQNIM
mmetsp:Transcript_132161/g.196921  ORF Transcript_132161/g.196921 Transcript_132161/m.196921 type:complete len:504 (-) Transcript_132161:44-1555(-)